MKKILLPVLLLHLAVAVNAATYYFSAKSGDDSRTSTQAQNSSSPWKTIGKLNSIMSILKPGDNVLFNRDESFYGAIIVGASGAAGQPITFGAYGSGNAPTITGFTSLTNWTMSRSNVWEVNFSPAITTLNMVVINKNPQSRGRWPNANATNGGYLNIDSHNGQNEITSSQLPSSPNWTGGDVVIRKNRWILDRSGIGYHAQTSLGFNTASANTINDNYGFFITNHTNTLDQNGEWFYDKTRGKLQMYFASNSPAKNVKAGTIETLVTISFRNFITFSNLNFTGANSYAFDLTNSNNITIDNCTINFTGIDGVRALSSAYFTFKNSTVSNTNNNALNLYWYCNNALITDNTFQNTGTRAGMGQNGVGAINYLAIFIVGNNNLIQYNNVLNTGYDGIHIEGDYDVVKNNFVNNFCYVLDDGGGIYTGQGLGDNTVYNSKTIQDNIVMNGIGAPNGTSNHSYLATQGIYLDDNTNHVTVTGNTTANCAEAGIFNHNATYTNITNNTMYNNGEEQFLGVRVTNPASNVTLTGNIMFAKTATQFASRIESYSGSNNLAQFGIFNNNYYCRPIDNNYIFYDMYQSGGTSYTSYENLDSWKAKFGFDANSKGAPATIPSFTYTAASGVNKYTNGTYSQNVNDVNGWSPTNDLAATWNSGKLDGGTLQVSAKSYSSNNGFYLDMPIGTVTAGKGYLLTFSLQGASSTTRPMQVYLRKHDAPNTALTQIEQVPVQGSRNNFQFGFVPSIGDNSSSVMLSVVQPNAMLWVDNVTLQEATVKPTNLDDYIVFQYNASKTAKTVSLSGTYYDAKGATYSGSVTLQPYASVVLFKQGPAQFKTSTEETSLQAINLQGNLTNSAAAATSSASANLNWSVDNQNKNVTSYEVERSSDAINFITVGKTSVKNISQYNFSDLSV